MIDDIIAYLKTVSAVTAIVGTSPAKIFKTEAPKKAKNASGISVDIKPPYVLIENRGGPLVRYMGGRAGTREPIFMIEAVHWEDTLATSLYRAVHDALDTPKPTTWGTIFVQYSEMDEPTDTSIPPTDGSQQQLHRQAGNLHVRADY